MEISSFASANGKAARIYHGHDQQECVWGKGTDPSEETFPTHRAEVWRRDAREPGSRVGKLEAGEMARRCVGDARTV